jgi:ADP-ribose pyrophosphatase YjhB (NUDIX family)
VILALLLRLWALPWPPAIRRRLEGTLSSNMLQRLLLPHFRVGVVGIILNEEGRVLLLRHTYRNRFPWGLPTGFLETREQPAAALRREIREESGLEVELHAVWRTYTEPDRPHVNIVFQGTAGGGRFVASTEVSAAEFFDFGELPPLMPDQRRILENFSQTRSTT